ncbi:S-DNA-T family DNA segregation ATPase FtsK/SpoIIIE [Geomicrobium halophilum]|uniref:S-DNA-T family DNA segregation ATPase FtsK/SpoIIIE n=1 Tax=Geomicrobium halophilum TaxID=549000 RepID=A0A841PGU5_9BACL|nr:DNA translocase FtsK [Geomicrobium halophilum]MBB6448117.1 S-DNA-T family DNA segregation ATPase FtsK/SpoIIIE [Geomicrobium halophilum]
MSRKWSNIFRKLNRYFFGEQSEKEDLYDPPVNHNQRRKREITSLQEDSGPRVIHRYPKGGNFHFPMDIQATPRRRREYKERKMDQVEEKRESYGNYRQSHGNYTQKEDSPRQEEERQYFSNSYFSPEHIPSPVYGFQTQRSLIKQEEDESETQSEENSYGMISESLTIVGENEPQWDEDGEEKEEETKRSTDIEETNSFSIPETDTASEQHKEEQNTTNPQPQASNHVREQSQASQHQQMKHSSTEDKRREKKQRRAMRSQSRDKKRTVTPYNVMMTPFDRLNYERRKAREKEQAERIEREQQESEWNGKGEGNEPTSHIPEDNRESRTETSTPAVQPSKNSTYELPPLDLLAKTNETTNTHDGMLQEQQEQLEATLHQFHVDAKVTNVTEGPSIIRFEVQPAPGVKVNKITNLNDDIKLAMAATDLRIEAPIPGKNAIGIEVPKQNRAPVALRDLLETEAFQSHTSPLAVALGLDITGDPSIIDLGSMPHGLIAGATGSGKSVCINSILLSLLYKADPEEVKLLLIDPKVVELAFYKDIPHLAAPVVTDPKEATMSLKWSVAEMERRYQAFAEAGVRDIRGYNKKADEPMPYLVIVIDELADLMMVAPQDVESSISRIAQKARACGIHLLVATQRPSVDVITGLIKANIPTRAAFAVSSMVDSRTILDTGGAERLIGKGDMLLSENGASKVVRLQGTFVSDQEIDDVASFVRQQKAPKYLFTKEEVSKDISRSEEDDLIEEVSYFVVQQGNASTSLIQRRFHIGYNRAARLMDMMESKGIVSEAVGTKSRHVLMNAEQLSELFGK